MFLTIRLTSSSTSLLFSSNYRSMPLSMISSDDSCLIEIMLSTSEQSRSKIAVPFLLSLFCSSNSSNLFFAKRSVSIGAVSQKSHIYRSLSSIPSNPYCFSTSARKYSCGPSSACWQVQMTFLDYLVYLRTVIAMLSPFLRNSSLVRLQTTTRLLMLQPSLVNLRNSLKNTKSTSASLVRQSLLLSMQFLTNIEIVLTDLALTSSVLVSHQSRSRQTKQCDTLLSQILSWQSMRHRDSIASIFTVGFSWITSLRMIRMNKSGEQSSKGRSRFSRLNLFIRSTVTLRETSRQGIDYCCRSYRQYSGKKLFMFSIDYRQQNPNMSSPWGFSPLSISSFTMCMQSPMLEFGFSRPRVIIISRVFTLSRSICPYISCSFCLKLFTRVLFLPCSTFLKFVNTVSLSFRRVFSSGSFHSAIICFISMSKQSGRKDRMAAPIKGMRSTKLLMIGRSQQLNSIFLCQIQAEDCLGQISSSGLTRVQSNCNSQHSSFSRISLRTLNILSLPISSGVWRREKSCRNQNIPQVCFILTSSPRIQAISSPEGQNSSNSVICVLAAFFSQTISVVTLSRLPCLHVFFISSHIFFMYSRDWGSSVSSSPISQSQNTQIYGFISSISGWKYCRNCSYGLSLMLSKKETKKYLNAYFLTTTSLLPYPSQSSLYRPDCDSLWIPYLSAASFRTIIERIQTFLSLSRTITLSMLLGDSWMFVITSFRIFSLSQQAKMSKNSSWISGNQLQESRSEANFTPICTQVDCPVFNRKITALPSIVTRDSFSLISYVSESPLRIRKTIRAAIMRILINDDLIASAISLKYTSRNCIEAGK